ncbi:MAG: class I SAM-dependent methyltransferase [Alphaproteobacteria bacterium]|jgi:SAM-dependent methyltransferase|nr:class I SAM-dependent methyltransferase [Alphaproteobacteria bacterium]
MTSKPANAPGEFWDQRYADDDYVFGQEPNQWMAAHAALLQPGMNALVPGDGEGRNGVWLAQQGLHVTTLDASPVGVAKAKKLAAAHNVLLAAQVADLRDWNVVADVYDLLISAFLHVNADDRTDVHRKFAQSLKPGGLMLLEGFAPDHLGYGRGGPKAKEMLFTIDGLREDFAAMMDIEHLEEARIELPASERHGGPAVVTRLRARRKST